MTIRIRVVLSEYVVRSMHKSVTVVCVNEWYFFVIVQCVWCVQSEVGGGCGMCGVSGMRVFVLVAFLVFGFWVFFGEGGAQRERGFGVCGVRVMFAVCVCVKGMCSLLYLHVYVYAIARFLLS